MEKLLLNLRQGGSRYSMLSWFSQSHVMTMWGRWRVLYRGCAWRNCCWTSVKEAAGTPCCLALVGARHDYLMKVLLSWYFCVNVLVFDLSWCNGSCYSALSITSNFFWVVVSAIVVLLMMSPSWCSFVVDIVLIVYSVHSPSYWCGFLACSTFFYMSAGARG